MQGGGDRCLAPCASSSREDLARHRGASVFSSAKWKCHRGVTCQTADSRWARALPTLPFLIDHLRESERFSRTVELVLGQTTWWGREGGASQHLPWRGGGHKPAKGQVRTALNGSHGTCGYLR